MLQFSPHCHAPIHPPAPVPTPVPHPAVPLEIIQGAATVRIGGMSAARLGDHSVICSIASCVPAGPGVINKGSGTVRIEKMPAARLMDTTSHPACVAPIPAPVGKIIGPGCPTVRIGG
jgi:uncharacterized Zn-binding protein involved in type VI secretion